VSELVAERTGFDNQDRFHESAVGGQSLDVKDWHKILQIAFFPLTAFQKVLPSDRKTLRQQTQQSGLDDFVLRFLRAIPSPVYAAGVPQVRAGLASAHTRAVHSPDHSSIPRARICVIFQKPTAGIARPKILNRGLVVQSRHSLKG
jgi:hypothetical protein